MEITARYYLRADGQSPFQQWFDGLDRTAALKVQTAIARLEHGNTSNVKSVGGGVYEYKIHFGTGYRVYFGKEGAAMVILLGGGTKARQARDITDAHTRWQDYQHRKSPNRS